MDYHPPPPPMPPNLYLPRAPVLMPPAFLPVAPAARTLPAQTARKRPPPLLEFPRRPPLPPALRREVLAGVPDELGKLVLQDVAVVKKLGLLEAMKRRRPRGDFGALQKVAHHGAARILRQYRARGAPVVLSSAPWTKDRLDAAMERGSHRSAIEHLAFLREDMADYVNAGHWMVLPYSMLRDNPGLRLSPFGVAPQRDRRPRPIVDLSFYGINDETVPIAPTKSMQFGRAFERVVRHIVLADPKHGPVKLIKVDCSDGFYRCGVRLEDVVKLGVVLPSLPGEAPLVALPLALPMGWKNSPPIFCAATETVADVANQRILKWRNPPTHRLEAIAADAQLPPPPAPPPPRALRTAVPVPRVRDPHLSHPRRRPLGSVDVYVDDFIGVAQGSTTRLQRLRRILLDTLDDVFRPNDPLDSKYRKEPASVKKLRKGDATWATVKMVLGWIIDTDRMLLYLPPHRLERLNEILNSIPPTRKRVPLRDWHKILGELRSMSVALPGSRGLFSLLQEAFRHKDKHSRIRLSPAVHSVLDDFRWLARALAERPTRLQELVPLPPTLVGAHDASGYQAGGVWLPNPEAVPRPCRATTGPAASPPPPIVWRMDFPKATVSELVTWKNPKGAITNSDFELAGNFVQHECAVQNFDIRERTILSSTDNTPTLFWSRKGSTTTVGPAAYLLRLQSYHQRYHRYVPRHDFLAGSRNVMADDASRLQHLSDVDFLTHFNSTYPQPQSWRLWTPPPQIISSVISALHRRPSKPASFLLAPRRPMPTGCSGTPSALLWPSTPYLPISKSQLLSSKSSPIATELAKSHPVVTRSDLERSRMSYGALAKRSLDWAKVTLV